MPRRGGGGRGRRRRRRRRRRRILLVGGLVAFGAYKMSTRDADRVKEHTGTDPEEMTDEELAQAMDELGIEKQQRTAEDQEQGSGGGSGDDSVSAQLDEIERLAELHESGILTDQEFQDKKRQILGLD
ncbi:MAG: SHOCT domain-containing protein [Gemmatimonadales bacterium]